MENPHLGKWLIIIGIIIAIVPMIALSAYTATTFKTLGIISSIGPYAFFIIGIIIAIFGEYLRRK